MAAYSSILAWKIPWTEEPGGLHRVAESDTTEHAHVHAHTFPQAISFFRNTLR